MPQSLADAPALDPGSPGADQGRDGSRWHTAFLYRDGLGSGGYPRDARWLVNAVAEAGVRITFVAEKGDETEGFLGGNVDILRPDQARGRRFDLVHAWGLFDPVQLLLMRQLARSSVLVVSPLSHLLPAHLRYHAVKKRPYVGALRALVPRDATVHSFGPTETASVERWLGGRSVFEATLGLYPSDPIVGSRPSTAPSRHFLVFFGRNDVRQKGLDTLVSAFASARLLGYPHDLVIAGAPEGSSASDLDTLIRRHRVEGNVHLVGRLDEDAKWWFLRNADCLVYPSRHDGPPRPVREALSIGTPAIVTHETTMGHVVGRYEAGLAVPHHPQPLAHAIIRSLDEVETWRHGAAEAATALAWSRVGRTYAAYYRLLVELRLAQPGR